MRLCIQQSLTKARHNSDINNINNIHNHGICLSVTSDHA